jgi:Fusaric acid resistance protein family
LKAAGPPLLFGLRLWASVSLALYVAFWLELDNPYWAGTSAAIACQPHLGASLRKGWYRMIGTLVGAVMIVVLTACFPQDRVLFLGALTLWGGASGLAATLLRNFGAYAAALASYTAAIVAGDLLGATGGECRCRFSARRQSGERDLFRHRVCRNGTRRHRSRRRPVAFGCAFRGHFVRDYRSIYRHVDGRRSQFR